MDRRTVGIVAALLVVYVVWGSTYLAILFAIDTLPPFLMASARWIAAGGALYTVRRLAGDPAPSAREWRAAALLGVALIAGGNGAVSWAELHVPSGLAALLVAIVPLWIALIAWNRTGERPTTRTALGLALGLAGVALLLAPAISGTLRGSAALLVGSIVVLLGTLSWALGSWFARSALLPRSLLLAASMEMLAGGAALGLAGLARGEASDLDLAGVSARSWASLAYLAAFGSILAFSAYVWLLRVVRPETAATYAFVNPVVAVALGALFAGEAITTLTLAASGLIVAGVALVVLGGAPARRDVNPRR